MIRAFQWDLGRQVERLDWLIAQMPRYAAWGYQELYLHLEDAVHYPSLPGVGRPDAYSHRQLGRLVDAASRAGLRVVPIANLLGHTQYLIKVPEWRDLNELRAPDGSPLARGQLCPLHPRTLELAGKLIRDLTPFCTAGKIHVGLDESFHLGRHPLSRAEVAEVGLATHFARYVGRLRDAAGGAGLRLGLWADMLALLPAAIPQLPADVIAYDWYYYPFARHPRVELHNFADCDLAGPLRARGIEYWGCPMNGAFRFEPMPVFGDRLANLRSWWRRCADVGAAGFLVTSWEANRLALELTTAVDAAAAGLWLDPAHDDATSLLTHGFAQAFGPRHARERARAALACDERAFSGYARWEIDERWDVGGTREGAGAYRREVSFFTRLLHRPAGWPAAFAASIRFRLYLAERDVFVRTSAEAVFALRRRWATGGPGHPQIRRGLAALAAGAADFATALAAGRRAAREMWSLTRDPKRRGPNDRSLRRDEVRLRAWRRWLSAAAADHRRLRRPSPVCGAWQLRFVVRLTAPALQQVVVEQQQPDGSWAVLHRRFTIEFRAFAARPHTDLRREFSLPIASPASPLRLAVRGLGQVQVGRVELTDGVEILRARAWPRGTWQTIGDPAPAAGLPTLDWTRNTGAAALQFDAPGATPESGRTPGAPRRPPAARSPETTTGGA
jgi:hypothetical protein